MYWSRFTQWNFHTDFGGVVYTEIRVRSASHWIQWEIRGAVTWAESALCQAVNLQHKSDSLANPRLIFPCYDVWSVKATPPPIGIEENLPPSPPQPIRDPVSSALVVMGNKPSSSPRQIWCSRPKEQLYENVLIQIKGVANSNQSGASWYFLNNLRLQSDWSPRCCFSTSVTSKYATRKLVLGKNQSGINILRNSWCFLRLT